MLSIAKLRVGSEAYQLTGVAQSLDDYYSGSGEAAGWWAGTGANVLGLDGEVDGDDLRAVLAGIQPGTGGLSPNGDAIRPHPRRVPGFDLTFKAPKSVSVLYAISDDPRVQGAIIDASEAALRDTLAWLEREGMAVRRGSDDRRYLANLAAHNLTLAATKAVRVERGAELVAAVFRHRTSRAGDPLLHWHVLVPNMVRGADGRWSAFLHPEIFRLQRAAGEVFQAALRDGLTQRLGVRWRPGRHVPEIAGIPQAVLDAFSKRSAEIAAWLDDKGRAESPSARQDAVLATRRGKPEMEGERLDLAWKREATALGFGPEHAEALLHAHPVDAPWSAGSWQLPETTVGADGAQSTQARTVPGEVWMAGLLAGDLLASDATFTLPDLYRALAQRLGDGATVTTIDRITAHILASDQVLPVDASSHRDGMDRWTTKAMAATERRLLDAYAHTDTHHPIDPTAVDAALDAYPTLGRDQSAALRTLTGSCDSVTVLIGPAGTGKTHTLAAISAAYRAAGLHPVGAAPSARAAAELETGAGIDASTLHSLRYRWRRPGEGPDAATVLIIDEAAMATTGDLEPLLTATIAAGGRVLLVGDHHQLPEVGPGGALAAAATRCRTVTELTVNRRQLETWEHEALAELRAGSVPTAVDAYRTHNRVVVTTDHQTMVTTAVDRYIDALRQGQRPVLLAGTNNTVRVLNDEVRTRLAERGALDPDAEIATSHHRSLVVGERVVLRRNATIPQPGGEAVRVRNSDVATIIGPATGGGIQIRRDTDNRTLILSTDYLAAGWVDHAYAVTAHRAQGGTWDTAIAVGLDGLYREAAYVQLSRGRHSNTLVIPAEQMHAVDAELTRHNHGIPLPGDGPDDPYDELLGRLARTGAKQLALTRDPDADVIAELAATHPVPELEALAARARTIQHAANELIGIDPGHLARSITRAEHTARHVHLGAQVKAFDRHNIGIVTAIDDQAGTIDLRFTSRTGITAERTLPWTETQLVDRHLPPARALPPEAQHHLDTLRSAAAGTLQRWERHLVDNGVSPGDAERYDRAVGVLVDRQARHLAATQPAWLTDTLGPRPDHPHAAQVWDHTVDTIAHHRLRHHQSGTIGLDLDTGTGGTALRHQVLQARHQIRDLETVTPQQLQRSHAELVERRNELDAILTTAPPDTRRLIDRLTRDNQPTLAEAHDELQHALDQRDARRQWILQHWPHMIEHLQVEAALDPTEEHHPDRRVTEQPALDTGPEL